MALASTVLRGLGRSIIPKLFDQGYSANAALTHLKSLGYGYQRKRFLTDWREITGAKKLERAYKFIPRKYALSYQLMAPTETFQQHEYKYVFEVTGKDSLTGEPEHRTMSMGSEKRYSIDEVEGVYGEIVTAEEDRYRAIYNFEPEEVRLKVVYRRIT